MKVPTLILMLSALGTAPTWACSYDGQFNNPFTESYPGSLDVVIATQNAVTDDKILRPELVKGAAGLQRSVWWLKLFVQTHQDDLPDNVNIYLADSHLWSRVSERSKLETHTSAPEISGNVLVISEAALSNVIAKKITLEESLGMGIAIFQ